MSSNTIFLRPGESVNVDGVEFSFEEIKENKIDSILLRKHLEKHSKI